MKKLFLLPLGILISIFSFSQNTWKTYTETDGLINNSIKSIAIDNSDNLWIGTEAGVSMFDGTNFTNYTTTDGLANNYVLSVFVDSQDNIWFGTMGGGVSKFDGTNWTTYSTADGLASTMVYAIYEDGNNNMWFGTTSGVSLFDGTNWTTYNTSNGLSSNVVSSICQDAQGNMWIGLWSSGISVFNGTNWTQIVEDDSLVYYQVTNIFRDNNNKMWVGTSDGISVFADTATWVENFVIDDGIIDDWIQGIDEDSQGNLWFASYTNYLNSGGASIYDGAIWTNYNTSDGMASEEVTDVLVKEDDNIWFGTSLGLTNFYLSTEIDNISSSNNSINVYPNPAKDKITITSENTKINSITISDITGKEVLNQQNPDKEIDLSEITSGVFIINIITNSGNINKKLIIN